MTGNLQFCFHIPLYANKFFFVEHSLLFLVEPFSARQQVCCQRMSSASPSFLVPGETVLLSAWTAIAGEAEPGVHRS
jgi:hypothetical protein